VRKLSPGRQFSHTVFSEPPPFALRADQGQEHVADDLGDDGRCGVEGIGTGLAGPVTLNLALRGVLPADSGAAGTATSAAGQLGSSVGAALFNIIAGTVVAGYLRAPPGGSVLAGTVHGFDMAMVWAAAVMVAAALPVALFVNAPAPAPRPR
jgi:hypothetical protein